jgi:hypothetical protein
LFGPLKNHLGGKRFTDDEKVKTEVWKWVSQQSKDFHAADLDALVKQWDKYINDGRGYIEKCFFLVQTSHVLHSIYICDLFTASLT